MSRSQRHKILVENYPSDCKITAEHVISPGYLRQPGPIFNVPMGPPGGPLQGSSLAGPNPASMPDPRDLLRLLGLAAIISGGGPVSPPEEDPELTSLSPNEAILGSGDILLTCHGTGFTPTSVINFAGYDEPTTFVSETAVTTGVKPSLGWGVVSVPVFIKSGPLVSETLQFEFTDPAAPIDQAKVSNTKTKGK